MDWTSVSTLWTLFIGFIAIILISRLYNSSTPKSWKSFLHRLNNSPVKEGKPRVVLFFTGALSPIHRAHIRMFAAAKELLESLNYDVVGGMLCPSHDLYMIWKLKTSYIPSRQRQVHGINN